MITVYWAVNSLIKPEGIRADPPINIRDKITREKIKPYLLRVPESVKSVKTMTHKIDAENIERELEYNKCPAWVNEINNLYGIKSYVDFKIKVDDNGTVQHSYDEMFMERYFRCRHWPSRLFSVSQDYTFFTDSNSLLMSQLPAYYEDNDIANKTMPVAGVYDIGKYQRFLEFAFHLKKGIREIEFSRNDIMFYVKFHTTEQINFKRFFWTPEMQSILIPMMRSKDHKRSDAKSTVLSFYYNIFNKYNFKEKLLKEIEKNLCKDEDESGKVK